MPDYKTLGRSAEKWLIFPWMDGHAVNLTPRSPWFIRAKACEQQKWHHHRIYFLKTCLPFIFHIAALLTFRKTTHAFYTWQEKYILFSTTDVSNTNISPFSLLIYCCTPHTGKNQQPGQDAKGKGRVYGISVSEAPVAKGFLMAVELKLVHTHFPELRPE